MLKRLTAVTASIIFTIITYGQGIIRDFKVYAPEEVNLTSCPFDPDANAVVLFDVMVGNHDESYSLIRKRHVRIKILKDQGADNANITIPYYSQNEFELINEVEGAVLNVDEKGNHVIKDLKRSDIFNQKVNKNYSLIKFALPGVKAGSIIEYKYTSTCKSYSGLDDWYFQSDLPTMLSSFSVVIIPGAEFSYVVHKKSDMRVHVANDRTTGNISFAMQNIPGLRNEPFMDAPKDYMQRVQFQLSSYTSSYGSKVNYINTWNDVTKELMSEQAFGRAIDRRLSTTDGLIAEVKSLQSPLQKMQYLHAYFRKTFSWTGINSKYAIDGLKDVWDKKKGTSGELNLLFINLLKQTGVEVYPMLVSERDHGKVNPDIPLLDQFNKVVAYVVADNKSYVIDASDEHTPSHLTPYKILNTHAFLLNNKKSEIITLTDNDKVHSNVINFVATVQKDGSIEGKTTVLSSDYARIERAYEVKNNKEKFVYNYFTRAREISVDSLQVKTGDTDTEPLQQEFKFTTAASSTGDYHLLNLNLFTGHEKNPFTANYRFSRINYGCKYQTTINQKYLLPEGCQPDGLPKNVHLKTGDGSIEMIRVVKHEANELSVQLNFKVNKSVFTPEYYSDIKDFYNKMINLLNEQVVLKNL
ncbi:DUF3857 domain-containing protein [Aridibaculum aurantiacum]|uniref:DUF3857 domain-containing protein n=1 Tax=Aridibaculum aurantiacum TaxID=2810307 RepID=UPI001A9798CC|nr:DUF3857 domain-containing protein [Aridibaculum aurantiacum]